MKINPKCWGFFFFLKQKLQFVDNKKIAVPAKKLTFFLKDLLKVIEQEI